MAYLLDTDIFIAAMKAHPAVRRRLAHIPAEALILSPMVIGELETGVKQSTRVEHHRARLATVVAGLELAPLGAATSRAYARIHAGLEPQGTPIGANDSWIAAQAVVLDAILITENLREFSRVDGLRVENWLEPESA